MNPISAIIAVKNNPSHIFESLNSIKDFCDEIIIIDIGMDYSLKTKLNEYLKLKIISLNEFAPYVELIREKTKQHAKNEFILFLDPDEIVSEELKKIIIDNLHKYDYFSIPRKNIIFGKWIKHSRWWPDYQIRLFKKNHVVWPKQIHKQPEVEGNGLTIEATEENALLHYNYENLDEYLEKARRYAKAEATELTKKDKPFTLGDAFKKSVSEFISRYFAEEGYRDGMHGFVLSILQMFYSILVFFYYWEIKGRNNFEPDLTVKETRNFFSQTLLEINHWSISKKLLTKPQIIKIKIVNFFIRMFNN